ncbi:MAG: 2-hydroxyacyl-CoA dehydratase family protein [Myxococcales bacterium]|jgi:benzoyl-CoA reductase/2-hydroxyglutaryl-CoA dehydratase subunit BcrC/BadD/HgdB
MPPFPSRLEVMEHVRALGREVVAVMPIHYPRAMLRAHRLHPIELWGPAHVARHEGSRHFQAYTCDIVLKATSFVRSGGIAGTKAILVPHTCDALQGMASVLDDFLHPEQRVLTLYLPRGRRTSDREFLRRELRRLSAQLAEVSGHEPSRADWAEAFEAEDAADSVLANLYQRRGRLAISDREFYRLIRSREYLTAEQFCERADRLPEGAPPRHGVPLMISGIVAEPLELFDHIEAMGAHIAGDDLACGFRRVYSPSMHHDPFERSAAKLLKGPPDPTCGSPIRERIDALRTRMRAVGAKGLLVYDPKFCEPELFDVPLLRKYLGEAGFPVLHVEVELEDELPAQTLSRIEAFVETLT